MAVPPSWVGAVVTGVRHIGDEGTRSTTERVGGKGKPSTPVGVEGFVDEGQDVRGLHIP
ncbi:hypothetical protein ABZ644_25040 [Nocardiopsis alba]|uniref:hypothetical protein n=1 Tax=Nocardiopsis alba TaxID=53437 RepID=UPI0034008641